MSWEDTEKHLQDDCTMFKKRGIYDMVKAEEEKPYKPYKSVWKENSEKIFNKDIKSV